MLCQTCRYNRLREKGEKLKNTTRRDGGAFCNDWREARRHLSRQGLGTQQCLNP